MMDSITVGTKIRLKENICGDYAVGEVATILYIDNMDNVFVEWSDGKLTSFPEQRLLNCFEELNKT